MFPTSVLKFGVEGWRGTVDVVWKDLCLVGGQNTKSGDHWKWAMLRARSSLLCARSSMCAIVSNCMNVA